MPLEAMLGSLHAAEHSQIAVLPLLAMCDRWDIGGLSTNFHPQTGRPTIFIYDGHPGGIGITRRGYQAFEALVDDAHRLVGECPCESGCPSCVQSPKCGNLNEPLSKARLRSADGPDAGLVALAQHGPPLARPVRPVDARVVVEPLVEELEVHGPAGQVVERVARPAAPRRR